jgi:hypothetical protein
MIMKFLVSDTGELGERILDLAVLPQGVTHVGEN